MMTDKPDSQGQKIDLASLSAQQLLQVKKQLDEELEHLNNSFTKLRGAQSKFFECLDSIDKGVVGKQAGQPILVPLTTSLYVPGTISSSQSVVVDIGTGFMVEKTTAEAKSFYENKVKELEESLKKLETILQGKSDNLRLVEEVLRTKVR